MKKLFFLIFFFITSCSTSPKINDLNFSKEMNMDEFKIKLEEYAKNNPYPNMDN